MTRILIGMQEIVLNEQDERQIKVLLAELFVSQFWNDRALPKKLEQVMAALYKSCGGAL